MSHCSYVLKASFTENTRAGDVYNVPSASSAPCATSVLHDSVTFISCSGDNETEFSFCADAVFTVPNPSGFTGAQTFQVEEGSVPLSAQATHKPLPQIQLSMAKQTRSFQSQAVPHRQIVACSLLQSSFSRILQRTAMLPSRIGCWKERSRLPHRHGLRQPDGYSCFVTCT